MTQYRDRIFELLNTLHMESGEPVIESISPDDLPNGAIPVKPIIFSEHLEKKVSRLYQYQNDLRSREDSVDVDTPIGGYHKHHDESEPVQVIIPKVHIKIGKNAATSLIHSVIEGTLGDHNKQEVGFYLDPPFNNFVEISGTILGVAKRENGVVSVNIEHAYTDKFSPHNSRRETAIIPHIFKDTKTFYAGSFASNVSENYDDDPDFTYMGNFHTHFNYHHSSREYKKVVVDGVQYTVKPYIFEHVLSNNDLRNSQLKNSNSSNFFVVDKDCMGDIEIVLSISHHTSPYFNESKIQRLENNILLFTHPPTGFKIWISAYFNLYLRPFTKKGDSVIIPRHLSFHDENAEFFESLGININSTKDCVRLDVDLWGDVPEES